VSIDIVDPNVTDLKFHWPAGSEPRDHDLLPPPRRQTLACTTADENPPVAGQRLGSIDAQLSELTERVDQALGNLARLQASVTTSEQRTDAITSLEAGAAEADALRADVRKLRAEFRESERRQLAILEEVVQVVLADRQNAQQTLRLSTGRFGHTLSG
jgi:hypothetical protein